MTSPTPETLSDLPSRSAPAQCALCNAADTVKTAGFRQILLQARAEAKRLEWWECRACGGWFVDPVPTPEMITRSWETVVWADRNRSDLVAALKNDLYERILSQLARQTAPGELLDVGCNFGGFLERARAAGWNGRGFDPNAQAAEVTRQLGFDVVTGWQLAEAGFRPRQFKTIVLIDVFCYSWHPFRDLETYCRLLDRGGILAMRLTNKRLVLSCARALTAPGTKRDRRLSSLLQAQFHSIAPPSLKRILLYHGFSQVAIWPGAATARVSQMPWRGKLAYLGAEGAYRVTLGRVNVSPGILLFARKAV